jgi:hypothetical protein
MPCKCDGYEPSSELYVQKQELHEMCCQAQSIAHHLGKLLEAYELVIPEDLLVKLARHRRILLNHKKEELKKDIDKARGEVGVIENKIRKIKDLGGIPTDETYKNLDVAHDKLQSLKALNQEALLG